MSDTNFRDDLPGLWPSMRNYRELAESYELLVSAFDAALDRALRGEKLEDKDIRKAKALRQLHAEILDELKSVKS
jgi:hypothetical protein